MTDRTATLATIAADPSRVEDVPVELLPGLIGEAETLRARLLARLVAASTSPVEPIPLERTNASDRLLTAAEAAERLGVGRRWMYRNASSLPFTRRLSRGTLRFSQEGLMRWQNSRKSR